jgi:hypothetical protein
LLLQKIRSGSYFLTESNFRTLQKVLKDHPAEDVLENLMYSSYLPLITCNMRNFYPSKITHIGSGPFRSNQNPDLFGWIRVKTLNRIRIVVFRNYHILTFLMKNLVINTDPDVLKSRIRIPSKIVRISKCD